MDTPAQISAELETVWIIEWGDLDRTIFGVAVSVKDALAFIKIKFPDPYAVKWSEPECLGDGKWKLAGQFEKVNRYSTAHRSEFYITQWPLYLKSSPLEELAKI
jgi:hypothetical protein